MKKSNISKCIILYNVWLWIWKCKLNFISGKLTISSLALKVYLLKLTKKLTSLSSHWENGQLLYFRGLLILVSEQHTTHRKLDTDSALRTLTAQWKSLIATHCHKTSSNLVTWHNNRSIRFMDSVDREFQKGTEGTSLTSGAPAGKTWRLSWDHLRAPLLAGSGLPHSMTQPYSRVRPLTWQLRAQRSSTEQGRSCLAFFWPGHFLVAMAHCYSCHKISVTSKS